MNVYELRNKVFRKENNKYFIFGILAVFAVLLAYSFYESRLLKVSRIVVQSQDIPQAFVNKRIVFISDVHHGFFFSRARVRQLVAQINKIKPDVVMLGGDYVQANPAYIRPVFSELSKIKSKHGIYCVLGNHDHWEGDQLTMSLMKQYGFKICDNRSYWLKVDNDKIKIGGVGDLWEDRQIISNTTNDVQKSDFVILLSHNPDYLEKIKGSLVDLTLSGHTHGGQITLFGKWAPILPSHFGQKYRYGLLNSGSKLSYISSGVGTIIPPLRFFCKPEIALVVLKK